jgi:hypothetical protein
MLGGPLDCYQPRQLHSNHLRLEELEGRSETDTGARGRERERERERREEKEREGRERDRRRERLRMKKKKKKCKMNTHSFLVPSRRSFSQSVKLGSLPDTQTPSLTVFSYDVNVPHLETPLGYLQIVYYTNNPAVNNAVFYQCADVFFE